MTDEQIIKVFERLHKYCLLMTCSNCRFSIEPKGRVARCQLEYLGETLNKMPCEWDVEEIEQIIEGEIE